MRVNGDGKTNGEATRRPTIEEALLAPGEPRDRLDRVAIFAATQAQQFLNMFGAVDDRLEALEAEIARLKTQRDRPADTGGSGHGQGGGGRNCSNGTGNGAGGNG